MTQAGDCVSVREGQRLKCGIIWNCAISWAGQDYILFICIFCFYIENLLVFKENNLYYKIYNVYFASCSKRMWSFVNGCLLLRKEAGHLVKADGHVWVKRAEGCDMTGASEP